MKTLFFILVSIYFFSANAAGNLSKNIGFDLGLGLFSNYGMIGSGGRYFISDSQDIHMNVGLDLSGFIAGVGSRFYSQIQNENCYFVFKCKSKYFLGGTFIHSNGSNISVDGDGIKGEYKQSEGFAGNLTIGSYDIFGDSFSIGFELGYRVWAKRPKITFQSGDYLQKHKTNLETLVEDSANVALTFGWLF